MKRSTKSLILRKAAILVTVGCAAASLFSVAVSPGEAPSSQRTVSARAGHTIPPSEWNSQG
ncbi:hypothetical protein [Streptomyces sp. NPDC093097]|uniref:hypothetical protein n=1 Tax=Streptomyces sp. NPDC093097 TaxID=3366027 RepID=UPI00380F3B97